MSDPQQEYADAMAAYQAAMARLREAKRHIPPSPKDRHKQRVRDRRAKAEAASQAHYLANKEAIDAERVRARALVLLHQRLNIIGRISDE